MHEKSKEPFLPRTVVDVKHLDPSRIMEEVMRDKLG
jgi:hypothetical protein